jgi:hypothetical protein
MPSDPLCPVHKSLMAPATHWIVVEGKPFPEPIHTCTRSGCLYCFDDARGYRKLPQAAPIGHPVSTAIPRFRLLGR